MYSRSFPRREFFAFGAASLGLGAFSTGLASSCLASSWLAESPRLGTVEILDTRVISWKSPLYHGWPTITRDQQGELLLVFSGGREAHVCPFGRLEMMRSKDDGKTWGWPQVLYDGPIDDRDAGILVTPQNSILVTTFTSLAYEPILLKAENSRPGEPGAFATPELIAEWRAAHNRLLPHQRTLELGCYMLRSTDGGVTWSQRYRVPCNSPHGPISLQDGRLIYPGKDLWGDGGVGVWQSIDDGLSWSKIATIEPRSGDDSNEYHELHAVETKPGHIVCHIRNHNRLNGNETLQCESLDGGKTWSLPHTIGVWGLPSHLMKLASGRLVMTYGHRRVPLGIQMRFSDDFAQSWSDAVLLSSDGSSGDLGYPSTVECNDGSMVTVWYERLSASPLAQLRQATWKWKS